MDRTLFYGYIGPMKQEVPMDYFSGSGSSRPAFSHIDMKVRLKMRGFIELSIPPMFADLAARFGLRSMWEKGISPILFYLDLNTSPTPLIFGHPVESRHRIALKRHEGRPAADSAAAAAGQGGPPRHLLEMESRLWAPAHPGGAEGHAAGSKEGEPAEVGRALVLMMLTRLSAPPGRRNLTEPPEELEALRLMPWEGAYPSAALLEEVESGFQPAGPAEGMEQNFIWGLPNTDINQHVNVEEYLIGAENQFTALLHAAGQPLERHRTSRARFFFRKPFFPGQTGRLRGRLWLEGERSLYVGSFQDAGAEAGDNPRPNLAVRLEGVLEG